MKVFARLLLGTALVAAGLTGGATAAQAAPGNCTMQTFGEPPRGARVSCASGTGFVRIVIDCVSGPAIDPVRTTIFGPWVGVGGVSSAVCPPGALLERSRFQLF
ncbi:hypothetical protein ACTMTJ_20625 [Phytohabitans sp. LJ34]|uniref:hypothetical protein n=1 Tax=Phytohabitans sp. LJ34 TaxID=3452217 RepID=UPI003F8B5647